jgi:Endomembrane protein 70
MRLPNVGGVALSRKTMPIEKAGHDCQHHTQSGRNCCRMGRGLPLSWRRCFGSLRLWVAYVIASLCICAAAKEYEIGSVVPLWTNKIGPNHSPSESYAFYDALAWCRPNVMETRPLKLGEALSGDRVVKSSYRLPFATAVSDVKLCEASLSPSQVDRFIVAIQNRYSYELLLDDNLPLQLMVGVSSNSSSQELYTHIDFDIAFNGKYIIEARAVPRNPVELVPGKSVSLQFTYSCTWRSTEFPYNRRSEKYRDPALQRSKDIQWFGIFNSLMSVVLLIAGFGSILMRIVRRDVYNYSMGDGDDEGIDYGWKQIFGDVFRFPKGVILLCPFLGTGVQLLVLSTVLLILGALEIFHPLSRGTIQTAMLCIYAATAWIAGYTSGFSYKQMGGSAWIRNALTTVVVFCGPVAAVMCSLHAISLFYGSTRALPVWTILAIAGLWAVVTIPLTMLGAILGKNRSTPFPSPCGSTKIPREIPPCSWYRSSTFTMIISGLMPFSSIFMEIYALFRAMWGNRIFEIYEMLAIVFVILNTVTIITTMAAVYFQLSVENYHWWWNSLLYGGSVGVYVFAYSVFYYYIRSPLDGFMQASFFFGYSLLFSYAFFLQCGTVGFFSARWFVIFLYRSIKSD